MRDSIVSVRGWWSLKRDGGIGWGEASDLGGIKRVGKGRSWAAYPATSPLPEFSHSHRPPNPPKRPAQNLQEPSLYVIMCQTEEIGH